MQRWWRLEAGLLEMDEEVCKSTGWIQPANLGDEGGRDQEICMYRYPYQCRMRVTYARQSPGKHGDDISWMPCSSGKHAEAVLPDSVSSISKESMEDRKDADEKKYMYFLLSKKCTF